MSYQNDPFSGTFGTLESFVDRVSEVLKCPVTLENTQHQLLAYSRHYQQTDSARIETIIRRGVPEKVINRLWKDGIIPKLLNSEEPLFVEEREDIGLGARVAISIWKGKEVLGFIWVLEVKQGLDTDSLRLLKKAAAKAKTLLLQYQREKNHFNVGSQEFFWQLLTGHEFNEKNITDTARNLHIALPPSFAVVLFRFKETLSDTLEKGLTYFLKTSAKISIPFYTIEDKDAIILVGCEESGAQQLQVYKDFVSTFVSNMTGRFGVSNLDAGFGGIYTQFKYVAKSYREAKTVLSVHKKFAGDTEHIFSYQELGIYQFLDTLFEKRRQDGFNNIFIEQLIEYDQKNKTQLITTLRTYLDENENTHKAAAKLHIHVNTLSYRLKRIISITGMDLSKPNQKMMLYLDLKLLQWKNKASL